MMINNLDQEQEATMTPTTTPRCRRKQTTSSGDFIVSSSKEQRDEEEKPHHNDNDDATTMPSGIGYYSSIDKARQRAHLKKREQRELKERDRNLLDAMVRRFDAELRFNFDDLSSDICTRMEKIKSILKDCLTWDVIVAIALFITFLALTTVGLILLSSSSSSSSSSSCSTEESTTDHLDEKSILIVQEIMKDGGQCCCSSSSCWCNPDARNNKENETTTTTTSATRPTTPQIDTWKEHICDMPCIDCNQLLIACADYGAKGACILHQSRCSYLGDYQKRDEYSLCEPGCLNCLGMRYGCYYHQDPGMCITYNEYCRENEQIAGGGGDDARTTNVEQQFIEKLLLDFKHSLTSFSGRRQRSQETFQDEDIFGKTPNCTKLETSCKKGGSFSSYLDCLEWFISCHLVIVN